VSGPGSGPLQCRGGDLTELGVDAERLTGTRAGVWRYLSALLREWANCDLPFARVTLYTPLPLAGDALPAGHPYEISVVRARGPRPVWTHWALARAAREVDVLFSPAYVAPITYRGKLVVTVHDALQEIMPATFPHRNSWVRGRLYRVSARRADCVLTDSESSRRDVERVYRLDPRRVRAIPLGVDLPTRSSAADRRRVRERYSLGDRSIVLFVGKFSLRRNLPTLVEAFARLRVETDKDPALVLAGENHLGLPLERLGADLGLGDRLRILGHVPDDDLAALYAAAELFVYPSDHEGFGLPVLEAMAAGTPVITLDNSSLREVSGDAAVLLPRATVDGLAESMRRVLSDPDLRRELAQRGRARAHGFRWGDTAHATMTALAAVAAAGRTEGGRR
jgi:glycosyltransferase involved in cell wall biosynthesis